LSSHRYRGGDDKRTRREERTRTGKDVIPMTMAQLLLFVVALLLLMLSRPDQTRPSQLEVRYLGDHPPMQPTGMYWMCWEGMSWAGLGREGRRTETLFFLQHSRKKRNGQKGDTQRTENKRRMGWMGWIVRMRERERERVRKSTRV